MERLSFSAERHFQCAERRLCLVTSHFQLAERRLRLGERLLFLAKRRFQLAERRYSWVKRFFLLAKPRLQLVERRFQLAKRHSSLAKRLSLLSVRFCSPTVDGTPYGGTLWRMTFPALTSLIDKRAISFHGEGRIFRTARATVPRTLPRSEAAEGREGGTAPTRTRSSTTWSRARRELSSC
jgi:hypothetical protein